MLVLTAVCLLTGLLLGQVRPEEDELGRLLSIAAICLPLVVLALLVLTSIHELGHLLAAKMMGMVVHGFCVGPLRWVRRGNEWRFSWYDDMRISGFVIAVPEGPDFTRRKYLALFAGGPAGSLVAAITAYMLYIGMPEAKLVTVPLLSLSLLLFLLTLIPLRTGGMASDGHWILSIIAKPLEAERRLAATRLYALDMQDVPTSEWPPEIVDRLAAVQGKSLESVAARLYEVSYALATNDEARAIGSADALEDLYGATDFVDLGGSLRAAVFLDVALVRAIVQRDAARARLALASTGPVPTEFAFAQHETMAHIFVIEGDVNRARQAAANAIEAAKEALRNKPRILSAIVSRIEAMVADLPVTEPGA